MMILGIDPGSRITGYGLLNKQGNRLTHVENGTLYCADQENFAARLVYLFQELQKVVLKYKPEAAAVERIFYHKNPQSLQKLGEARGVLIACVALAGLPVFEYTARQVKSAVTGYGSASKDQMQQMVRKLLNLPDLAEENASDALGVAICHANSHSNVQLAVGTAKTPTRGSVAELLKKASFYR